MLDPTDLHRRGSDHVEYVELGRRCIMAIDSVEEFYHKTYDILLSKSPLRTRYRDSHQDTDLNLAGTSTFFGWDPIESDYDTATVVDLVAEVDNLRWFGRVNTDAFRKIIRKIDSCSVNGSDTATQVEDHLGKSEFATQAQCLKLLESLDKALTYATRSPQGNPESTSLTPQVFCTRVAEVDPSIPALPIFHAIESNDSFELGKLIDAIWKQDLGFSRLQFLHVLFECLTQYFSTSSWVDVLISRAVSFDAIPAIENYLRDVIIKLGRRLSKKQQMTPPVHKKSLSQLAIILDRLLDKRLNLLYRQDDLGRTPLHYACEYGLADICEIFLNSMKAWDLSGAGDSGSAMLLQDMQSRSPLQLSVLGGHAKVTRLLINFFRDNYGNHNKTLSSRFSTATGELLLFAIRTKSMVNLTSLLGTDIDINCCDALGQTPVYLAARSGNESFINVLLPHKPLIDRCETVKGWTPLIIASLEGHSSIVEILLKHGANVEHRDLLGWTAIDHASYRGHIPLAKALVKITKSLNRKQATEIQHQLKTLRQKLPSRGQPHRISSVRDSHIIVNLGSLDLSNTTPMVRLSPHLIEHSSIMHPESLFSLGVSIVDGANPNRIVPLPLLEDATNIPWIFTTTDPADAKLVFELFHNEPTAAKDRVLVGRGMTLLGSYIRSPHTKRESLNRDYTVPILSTATLEYIGAVTFSFIISTPLVLPETPPINTEELWFENGPAKVVGHRGSVLDNQMYISLNQIRLRAKSSTVKKTTDWRK